MPTASNKFDDAIMLRLREKLTRAIAVQCGSYWGCAFGGPNIYHRRDSSTEEVLSIRMFNAFGSGFTFYTRKNEETKTKRFDTAVPI